MKKVFKYGTGSEIPEGSQYLCTKVEEAVRYGQVPGNPDSGMISPRLVWHYFLVEVEE